MAFLCRATVLKSFVTGLVVASAATLTFAAPTIIPSTPVCIVGAGPAGLSAANQLQSLGYETVIFEKQSAFGGKCQAYYEYVLDRHGKYPADQS